MMDRFLRNNNVLRILALILACILWLAVHAPADAQAQSSNVNSGVTQGYTKPIHVQVNSDMVVTSMSHSTATVNVTTSSYLQLAKMPSEMNQVQLVVNAQGLSAGTVTLPIAAESMASNIQHYSLKPQTITLVLEKKATAERSVDVEMKGTVASGFTVGKLNVNAQSVEVSGAPEVVNKVKRVVGSLDVGGFNSTQTKIVNLVPVDANGNQVHNVDLSPSSVSVNVPVQPMQEKVNLQPEITGIPAPGYAVAGVKLDNTQVSEVGLGQSDLPKTGLNVPVDVSGLSKSTTQNVPVPLLQGMTKVTPDTVSAKVTIEPSATIVFKQVAVSVQNEPSGLKVTLPNNPKVDITLTGPTNIVQNMSAGDVQAYVDASNLKKGSTQATITVSVPKWVDVTNLSQRTVTVQVQ